MTDSISVTRRFFVDLHTFVVWTTTGELLTTTKDNGKQLFRFTAVVYCCLSCRHLNINHNKGQRRTTIQEENVVYCCLSCRHFSTHPQATCSIHVCAQKSPGLFFTTRRVEKIVQDFFAQVRHLLPGRRARPHALPVGNGQHPYNTAGKARCTQVLPAATVGVSRLAGTEVKSRRRPWELRSSDRCSDGNSSPAAISDGGPYEASADAPSG